MSVLYLIPNFLSETSPDEVFPAYNLKIISQIKHFIVENEKNARRFLKKVYPEINQQELIIRVINKHDKQQKTEDFLQPALEGKPIGLISDAGLPAIADPGARVVEQAHQLNIQVKPLVGPSSVFLALMASGLNGQHFSFNGYLPVKEPGLSKAIKQYEYLSSKQHSTQIFIETPYRTDRLFNTLINQLKPGTKLCIAVDLTGEKEIIRTMRVKDWKKTNKKFGKVPAVFLFLAE